MINKLIEALETLPNFLTTSDLISIGLFKDINQLYLLRKNSIGPSYIQYGKKILYPRDCIIAWIQKHIVNLS